MSKPVLYVLAAGVGIILLTISGIALLGRDPSAYIGSLGNLLALVSGSTLITHLLTKGGQRLDQVQSQTNGTLSTLHEALRESHEREVALAKALNPDVRVESVPEVDDIDSIVQESSASVDTDTVSSPRHARN